MKAKFSKKTKYVRTDGWRGYDEPIYAVVGANDTGTFEDSPCNSNVTTRELGAVKMLLKANKIPYREISCQTSNVFCIHRYVIVPPEQLDVAKKLISEKINLSDFQLLYAV
jgi:hypothetical protein